MKVSRRVGLLAMAGVVTGALTRSSQASVPNSFSSGTTISSSAVNANFTAAGPTGMIVAYGGSSAPTSPGSDPRDWLLCDGSAVSRTTYSALFTAIGITFGQGDGSSTFNVPDFRGRFLRGVDSTASNDPDHSSRTAINTGGNTGNAVGSLQGDGLGIKDSTYSGFTDIILMSTSTHTTKSSISSDNFDVKPFHNGVSYSRYSEEHTPSSTLTTETRPKNVYVNFLIKT
ncbi:MAG TPA: phage tail protein [bacterium]|nr:phage tail protein [bacterium]